MKHIAIDLGGRESQICVRSESGEILEERRYPTPRLGTFLRGREASMVILETSCEAFAVADAARESGHQVRVVPATLVRTLGVGKRGMKTDVLDARVLSEASCRLELPSVHIPTTRSREVRAICTSREQLVGMRTQVVCRVRSYLRGQLGTQLVATPATLPIKARDRLLKHPGGLPDHIERSLTVLESLNEQIAAADAELAGIAKEDECARRLMSVPGVGPVTAMRFLAAIDEAKRFSDGAHLTSYLGLSPGENTTGFRTKRTRLTKAGPREVRWALGQAAWNLYRRRPDDPIVQWAKRIAERRGVQVAIVALARKLALVLFAIWRNGTTYEPQRTERPAA